MVVELTKEEETADWYSVLGLEPRADDGAINKAFKKLSLIWHPDKNQGSKDAQEKFMRIKEAKLFLLDSKKRKAYDDKRNARLQAEAQLVRFKVYWLDTTRYIRQQTMIRSVGRVR